MDKYPSAETYRKLYQRFYEGRSVQDLIELAHPIEDKTVLDLCGGDGRLALKAVQCGAKAVILVDREKNMTVESPDIKIFISSVQEFLNDCKTWKCKFDRILCQQAVNYWLDHNTAKLVSEVLKQEGIFVFNTFYNKPSEKPTAKAYEIDGLNFVEISWLVGNMVHHVQIMEGMESHTTEFMWLSPEYLMDTLSEYFDVEVKRDRNSSLYRCIKKSAD